MKNELFREKALKKMSSPEQLNEYIRVTNPGVWTALFAVIIFLVGVCVWGVLGKIESTVVAFAISDGSEAVCYLKDADSVSSITEGQTVEIGDVSYTVASISEVKQVKDCEFINGNDYAKHVGLLSDEDWVYEIAISGQVPAGEYDAKIVTESISPMSFILN